ncbi:hypothetical protein GOBAR_AA25382 [Gossypium barbadense]|uniref:Uncharacterized protein n=1 Tax=Gossypium barbadense TaxID=3634 RepID=A0A2P5WW19_GOSBA|nr:hypothetical protein GOBAR_AA25382 [Gossypium barbadense]
MERVDDEDVKTMIALYCWNQSHQIDLIHLFAKLADVELAEDFTPLSEEHEVQDPYTVVSITFIDRRATVCGINIYLNAPPTSKNLNPSPHLQIHPVVIETDMDGDDGYDNNDPSDYEVEDFSDPDLNEISG